MKALILASILALTACTATAETALTDAQAGYDQAAYDACIDSDEVSEACSELVND